MKQILECPLDLSQCVTRIFKLSLFLTLTCLAFAKCVIEFEYHEGYIPLTLWLWREISSFLSSLFFGERDECFRANI